ncbi:MAG: hypothetical protein IJP07_02280 [Firmicutes bacterium]|nr:hypothetical protein [Bacillota bacterium]
MANKKDIDKKDMDEKEAVKEKHPWETDADTIIETAEGEVEENKALEAKLRRAQEEAKAKEEQERKNRLLKGAVLIAVFFVVISNILPGRSITAEYLEDSVILRGASSRTEILFEQLESVAWLGDSFEMGSPVEAKEKDAFYAGIYQDGSLPGESYQLFLDKEYAEDILLIRTAEGPVVIGSAQIDMLFLHDYLQDGLETAE